MDTDGSLCIIITGFVILLTIMGSCSALPQDSGLSGIGQVRWVDIEGGFYGIITPDGARYLPVNLPEGYRVDGVTVTFTGISPPDLVSMQMWGEPVEIQTISTVNENTPYTQSWYAPDDAGAISLDETQAERLIMAASGLQTGLDAIDQKVSSIAQNLSRQVVGKEQIHDHTHCFI